MAYICLLGNDVFCSILWYVLTYHKLTVVRVLEYAIDPQDERQIIGNIAEAILFNLSIILWLSGGCLMFLYWCVIDSLCLRSLGLRYRGLAISLG